MPAKIPLTNGMAALVDEQDAHLVAGFRWYARRTDQTWYATRFVPKQNRGAPLYMHNLIIVIGDPNLIPDHRDGNGLNNTRDNLRPASRRQNSANTKKPADSVSPYKGITMVAGKWQARVLRNGKRLYLGRYSDADKAATVYDEAIRAIDGEFGTFNFPLPGERSALTGQIIPLIGEAA